MTVLGFGFGVQALTVLSTNPEPTQVPCADLVDQPPPADWLRLERCEADPVVALHLGQGHPREAWAVLRSTGATSDDPVHIIVEIDDRELLSRMPLDGTLTEELQESLAISEGRVRGSDGLGMRARTLLDQAGFEVAPDVVVLRWGDRPTLMAVVAWLGLGGLGVVALAVTVLSILMPTHDSERTSAVS